MPSKDLVRKWQTHLQRAIEHSCDQVLLPFLLSRQQTAPSHLADRKTCALRLTLARAALALGRSKGLLESRKNGLDNLSGEVGREDERKTRQVLGS